MSFLVVILEKEGCAMDSCNPCVVRLYARYCCCFIYSIGRMIHNFSKNLIKKCTYYFLVKLNF